MNAIATCLPEPPLLELVLDVALLDPVDAALEPVLELALLELDDDPHAPSASASATTPATLAILPRESNPAVPLMCGAPSSASSAVPRPPARHRLKCLPSVARG